METKEYETTCVVQKYHFLKSSQALSLDPILCIVTKFNRMVKFLCFAERAFRYNISN